MSSRIQIAKEFYRAFAAGDRDYVESHLATDFIFSAPPDPHLDQAGFFRRCWPGAGKGGNIEFIRVIESGNEVIVTYEADMGGSKGRNTEILTFAGDIIQRTEVYFGWNVK